MLRNDGTCYGCLVTRDVADAGACMADLACQRALLTQRPWCFGRRFPHARRAVGAICGTVRPFGYRRAASRQRHAAGACFLRSCSPSTRRLGSPAHSFAQEAVLQFNSRSKVDAVRQKVETVKSTMSSNIDKA